MLRRQRLRLRRVFVRVRLVQLLVQLLIFGRVLLRLRDVRRSRGRRLRFVQRRLKPNRRRPRWVRFVPRGGADDGRADSDALADDDALVVVE